MIGFWQFLFLIFLFVLSVCCPWRINTTISVFSLTTSFCWRHFMDNGNNAFLVNLIAAIILWKFWPLHADVLQQGWIVDPTAQMLTVKKRPIVTQQKLEPSKLQRLTEYVFHLEHWLYSLSTLHTKRCTSIVYQLKILEVALLG